MADLPVRVLKREEPLSNRVAKQLEDLILKGAIKNGERLPTERALAEMFGVSRTVIREAVHSLSARGLIQTRTGEGTYVVGPTADSVAESLTLLLRSRDEPFLVEHLHEVRRLLETEIAAQAAARATDEDLAKLEGILLRMETAADLETLAKLDVEFHRALALATRNPLFIILLDSIAEPLLQIRRLSLRYPENVSVGRYHHRDVLDKVKTGDPHQARQAMAEHIDQSEQTMRKTLRIWGHSALGLRTDGELPPPPTEDGVS